MELHNAIVRVSLFLSHICSHNFRQVLPQCQPKNSLKMAIESPPAKPAVELVLPPSETRQHRWLTLQNGLEVVVVSDGKCDKAGVAMDVGVGHAQDPEGLEGCAHFW